MAKKYELTMELTDKEHLELLNAAQDAGLGLNDFVYDMLRASASAEIVKKMTADMRKAAETMGDAEARFIVDNYYLMQKMRIRMNNQIAAVTLDAPEGKEEPAEFLRFMVGNISQCEKLCAAALKRYIEAQPVGQWMLSQSGVGPVLAANLFAQIDITKAQTAGAIWRYAGLAPDVKWEKGCKRPWNASLKTACWKLGESFVKVSNKEDAFYGRIYKEAKARYVEKNEAGGFAERAAAELERYSKTTDAYQHCKEGHLPPAHIQAMAKRYAVKMFLSHLHTVWYTWQFKTAPPKPFAIDILGHAHYIDVPNKPEWLQ